MNQLFGLILALVTVAIVLSMGFLIIAEGKSQLQDVQGVDSKGSRASDTNGTVAWNATEDIQNAMDDIPQWLPIIVITTIGAMLIGLISLFRKL